MDLARELERYSFPVEDIDDRDIVRALKLEQPLETIAFKNPQLLAYHFGLTHPRFILSFDKGMGKTITYLSVLYLTGEETGKTIILCSENAKPAQRREIIRHLERWQRRWVFVEGTKPKRKSLWNSDNDVFICTYATLLTDRGLRAKSAGRIAPLWVDREDTSMGLDEWHKVLRNKSSGTFKMLKKFENRRMIFSSGSAGGKGVHSMWAVLHLCDRVKFSAYWPYVQKHSIIEETYFGKKLSGCANRGRWRKEVAPYIFHRRKDSKDYPSKTRQALEVRMEPWQKRAHDQLLKELIMVLPDGEFFASSNKLAAITKLQQFLICPKSISPDFGWGAGLEGILADAQDSELTHFVVSTPFVQNIDLLCSFFRQNKITAYTMQGGMKANDIDDVVERWTRTGGVVIQSIRFAESYELPAARIMYMLGYVHDPEQNSQAEDRIHRDIRVTPDPVDIYYVKNLGSYEEDIIDAMSGTADEIYALMHKPMKDFIQDV